MIRQVIATAKWFHVGSIALGSLLSLNPQTVSKSDFRAITRSIVVEIKRSSPAYAALEDVRHNYGFENVTEVSQRTSIGTNGFEDLASGSSQPTVHMQANVVRQLRGVTVSIEDEVLPAPTVTEAAEVLVRQELLRRANETENKKTIETKYGSPIVVARVESPQAAASRTIDLASTSRRNLFMPSREVRLPKNWKPERTIASVDTKLTEAKAFVANVPDVKAFTKPNVDPLDIRGAIRITGGLAYTPGQDTLAIYQEVDGAPVAQGEFFLSRGYFRLQAESLKGRLIAEIRNREGEMIGRGELLVADIAADRIQNKESILKVAPLFDGLIGKVVAGASSFKSLPAVDNARLMIAGLNREVTIEKSSSLYIDKLIRPGSKVLMKAQAPGYWGGIFFGEAGVPFEGKLFSHKIIDALLDLTSTNKFTVRDHKEKGVIWGRILVDGKPLAGAKVELPLETNATTSYFTGVLPDPNLQETSANGEFVVTGIQNELQLIRVTANGKSYSPIFTEVAPRHVSVVNFDVQPEREVQLSAYAAFTEETRPALFRVMGDEKLHEIKESGTSEKLQLTRGMSLGEVEGGDYYRVTRILLNGHETEISAPLFSEEWAQGFGSHLVVGQMEGDDFQVFVGTDGLGTEVQVHYIDNNGRKTDKQFGEAGGGFVLSGLPEGLHTITIVSAKSKKIVTQLVYVDDQAIHFVKKSLF